MRLATYRGGGGAAVGGGPLAREYGYRVEDVLDAEAAPAGRPDLVTISSFPDEAAKAAYEADPAHGDVERALHAAVDEVVWLTGRTAE